MTVFVRREANYKYPLLRPSKSGPAEKPIERNFLVFLQVHLTDCQDKIRGFLHYSLSFCLLFIQVLDNMIGSRYDRQARCAVPCCFLVNSKCHVSSDSEDEPESLLEEISSLTRSGGNEGLDVWQKFLQPLTPPLSPVKSHSECSSSNFPGSTVSERLQSVCDSLDAFSNDKLQPSNSETYLKTKLISDCMWNGQRDRCLSNASDIDLFPTPVATPCSSPPPVDCILPSNSNCVDPIAVFPMGVTADHQSVSSLSDSGRYSF